MKVMHFEIPAQNPEQLKQFYTKIFKWQFCQWKDAGFWYALTGPPTVFGIDGGIIDVKAMDIPLNSMIKVNNIDEILIKIVDKGGEVAVPKFYSQGVGFMAYFKDLDKNIFGLRQIDPLL